MNRRLAWLFAVAITPQGCAASSGGMSEAAQAEADECTIAQFKGDPSSVQKCTASCNVPNGQACTTLGSMHLRGHLVAEDSAKAIELFDKGCNLNDMLGCLYAGEQHKKAGAGEKAVQSLERACSLSKGKAAVDGIPKACFYAGDAYYNGTDVPKDPKRAEKLLLAACNMAVIEACDRFDFKPKK